MASDTQKKVHDLLHDAGNKRPATCGICVREKAAGIENADRFRSER